MRHTDDGFFFKREDILRALESPKGAYWHIRLLALNNKHKPMEFVHNFNGEFWAQVRKCISLLNTYKPLFEYQILQISNGTDSYRMFLNDTLPRKLRQPECAIKDTHPWKGRKLLGWWMSSNLDYTIGVDVASGKDYTVTCVVCKKCKRVFIVDDPGNQDYQEDIKCSCA